MSDVNSNPSAQASSAEQTVPKARLDELIAQKSRAEQEAAFLRGQLSVAQQTLRPQRQEQLPPELEALRTENPAAFNREMKLRQHVKELSAGFSTVYDQNDKLSFLVEHGAEAKKRMSEVESVIAQERAQGNFKVTRAAVFQWMQGQDRLRAEAEKASQPPPAPKVEAQTTDNDDAPPSDPKFAASIPTGTAGSQKKVQTREERMKALEGITF